MNGKVGIYCRLSDEDRYKKNKDDDSDSIANQKSMLLKYALNKGWEVINVYSDDDWSGADINRPQFQRLLHDCESGLINIVLCKTQSRFSRDMEIIERYIHNKFIEWGVRFISVVDNADTDNYGNKKSRQINGLVNEWYLEDLSKNIRSSLKNKREDGLYVSALTPYGYLRDPNNKNKLIIDPVAAEVVKKIFSMYKSGKGYKSIMDYLNNNGIKTPACYKMEKVKYYNCAFSKHYKDAKWNELAISRIIRNEVYIGNLIQGKTSYISYKNHKVYTKPKEEWIHSYSTHEAIIDLETWNDVQRIIKSHVRVSYKSKEIFPFSGKVHCELCGCSMTKQSYKTKEGKTAYLKCCGVRLPYKNCINKESIRFPELEKMVLKEINKQLSKYYNLDELKRAYLLRKNAIQGNDINKEKALLYEKENIIEKIERKKTYYKQVYEDKLEGIISQEDFTLFRDKINIEIEELQKRVDSINEDLKNVKTQEELIQVSNELLSKYKHIDELTREIVEEFVDDIIVGKIDKENNSRKINIKLNIINLC